MLYASEILKKIASLATELRLSNLHPQIAACQTQLQNDSAITVAVLGRFKAGKSSLLNTLAGQPVLPVGVVPVTAVITRLRAGLQERAEISFLNGKSKEVSIGEIAEYVSESDNHDNQKQVASVTVELPSLQPLAPLQFVDTPGLGSACIHNTEAALNWLPNVGAALVAISSDAPLAEGDLELLHELQRHTPKIILLLTKADLLSGLQREEVRAFVREQLKTKCETEPPVFFYSIRPELAELRATLERNVLSPLIRNRDQANGQIVRYKVASLLAQTINYLQIALAAATRTEASRQALLGKLAEERRQFDLLHAELNVLARQWSAHALESSLDQLKPAQTSLEAKITGELLAQFPNWKLRLPLFLSAWRNWVGDFLKRELGEVSRSKKSIFCEPLQQACAHLTRTLRAFHDRLAEHVKAALGVALEAREFDLEIQEPSAPPVHISYAFDAPFTTIGWLIPLTLFRKPIERALLRKSRYEVFKNLSRLASDWQQRVVASIDKLTVLAEQQARDELSALEQMLDHDSSKVLELKQVLDELEQFQKGFCVSKVRS